uniref:NADH-ubiquinone oxidoreductase chain 2 n=1 Tax=Anthaxia chinensis TaxID=2853461 RepID=A0A8H2SGU0_9COLE|nr:NADH dehydrogenase subunit 2 [Anthaxia chinensis]
MMSMYKLLFYIMLISSTFITISSQTWLGMWMGLEINLLSIIPLMNNSKNLFSSEASIKYFITQALASSILLFSILMAMLENSLPHNLEMSKSLEIILNSALLTKMGAAPFHFWFPEVIEGLSWMNATIILIWQKIAPMTILMYNSKMVEFYSMIILFSMIISGIIGIDQTSLRKIMAYSSINHMGWMIAAALFSKSIWLMYFIIYSMMTLALTLMFNYLKTFYVKQLFTEMEYSSITKTTFFLNFFSLGGLPPFLGFLPKWIIIQTMVENNYISMALIMIILTLMTLFYYMRLSLNFLLFKSNKLNLKINKITQPKNFFITTLTFLSLSSLITCTFILSFL